MTSKHENLLPLKRARKAKIKVNYKLYSDQESGNESYDQEKYEPKAKNPQWKFFEKTARNTNFIPKPVIHRIRDPSTQNNGSFILPYYIN